MAGLPLTYLTVDSIVSGVGASQVRPYVEGFAARDLHVDLHSFEAGSPPADLVASLSEQGIDWTPHRFGATGAGGGVARVAAGAVALRGAELVHARSDMAAASALLARSPRWVWDIRSFWIDQRIALGMVRPGSPATRAMRLVERRAAERSSAITTLTAAAIPELARRHGSKVADKARVVTTCVDLDRFKCSPFPDDPPVLLMSGSFNPLYDMATMLRFSTAFRRAVPNARLELLRPDPTPWDGAVQAAGGTVHSSTFAHVPAHLQRCHAGLSVCRTDHPDAIVAAMPTKIGELLASGRPVVANAGLGDVADLLSATDAGVVLRDTDDEAIRHGAHRLRELLEDPLTPQRCRGVADKWFSLDQGVATLAEIYVSL